MSVALPHVVVPYRVTLALDLSRFAAPGGPAVPATARLVAPTSMVVEAAVGGSLAPLAVSSFQPKAGSTSVVTSTLTVTIPTATRHLRVTLLDANGDAYVARLAEATLGRSFPPSKRAGLQVTATKLQVLALPPNASAGALAGLASLLSGATAAGGAGRSLSRVMHLVWHACHIAPRVAADLATADFAPHLAASLLAHVGEARRGKPTRVAVQAQALVCLLAQHAAKVAGVVVQSIVPPGAKHRGSAPHIKLLADVCKAARGDVECARVVVRALWGAVTEAVGVGGGTGSDTGIAGMDATTTTVVGTLAACVSHLALACALTSGGGGVVGAHLAPPCRPCRPHGAGASHASHRVWGRQR